VSDRDGEAGLGQVGEGRGDAAEDHRSAISQDRSASRAALGDAQCAHQARVSIPSRRGFLALSVEPVEQSTKVASGPRSTTDRRKATSRRQHCVRTASYEYRLEQGFAARLLISERANAQDRVMMIGLAPAFEAAHRLRGIGRAGKQSGAFHRRAEIATETNPPELSAAGEPKTARGDTASRHARRRGGAARMIAPSLPSVSSGGLVVVVLSVAAAALVLRVSYGSLRSIC